MTRDFSCTNGSFNLPYTVVSEATAAGTVVTASLSDMPGTGFPTGLKVAGFEVDLGVDLNGESVALEGALTYPAPIAGGGAGNTVQYEMPDLSGTRVGTADLASGSIESLAINMRAGFQFNPAVPVTISDNPLTCTPGAASSTLVTTRDFSCTNGSFNLPYTVVSEATAAGTVVTASLSDMPGTGFPTGLKVAGFEVDLGVDLNGESVALEGALTYPAPIAGGGAGNTVQYEMPDLSGTRVGTADLASGSIESLAINMRAGFQFNPAVPVTISDNPLTCTAVPEPSAVTLTEDFSCTNGSFNLPYTVVSEATAAGTVVTASLSDMPGTGFPTGLKVAGFEVDLGVDLNGESVALEGALTYPAPIAGGGAGNTVQYEMPDLSGTRVGTADLASGSIESLAINMRAGFQFNPAVPVTISDNPLTCTVVPEPAVETATTLVATSPAPGAVSLAATVAPVAAGTVEFFEGETKVGEQAVAEGAATLSLTGVAAGQHSYRADFVPTDAAAFEGSSSTVQDVTVAAVPAAATATALTGSSPAAAQVALSATVTPTAAGQVQFFEGAVKVGEKVVASGAAAVGLTGVSAGEHSYTAKFVPTDPASYVGSTSTVVKVTVAAVPQPGPSAACVKAQGDVTTTAAAVKKADAKVKSTKAAVKKATKAVKKAKGAKAKKAKAKLKKAKKAATKAAKAAKAAKSKHNAATGAVKANC
ncbi:Ig-like domain repeat protein [Nocardioides sp. W7]|uniref:Ig-like domain repeat protein n=1 Tax=Nocardioides sp. W7 TaxID=2931390 RepID=UPI001FD63167|nr:Ig-like domain repeat protein [Nocardioides sp. W7]